METREMLERAIIDGHWYQYLANQHLPEQPRRTVTGADIRAALREAVLANSTDVDATVDGIYNQHFKP
jgi:hypothetical protein